MAQKVIGPDYITRDELKAILDDEWQKLERRLAVLISDAMTACGVTWLPGDPSHIGACATTLKCLTDQRVDEFVVGVERNIVSRLHRTARPH